MKLDHSPELPNILSRSKLNSVSQSPPSKIRSDSDSFQINSENNESFQQLTINNNGNAERRPLSELQVLSPDSHSVYSDDW